LFQRLPLSSRVADRPRALRWLRLRRGRWRHDSVHPQKILHHLSVIIEGVGDGKCRQMQAELFSAAYNVFSLVNVATAL
jgi:hypothetical protein